MYLRENETIGSVLHEIAERFPTRTAVIDSEGRYTFAELEQHVNQLAGYLLGLGIKKADHIGIWAKDDAMTLTVFYALWRIGAVAVPLCTSFVKAELERCCEQADLSWIIAGTSHKGQSFSEFIGTPDSPVRMICIENARPGGFASPVSDSFVAQAASLVTPADPDTILFTSGTTGAGKPVVTTHYNRINTVHAQAETLQADEKDVFCSALPMYHCFSLTATILAAMSVGACVCFPADRHSQTILQAIADEKCTVFTAVPTLFSALLRRYAEQPYDLTSLKKGLIGGSTYSPDLFIQIEKTFSMTLLSSLGQTEATAGLTAASMDDPLELRAATIGTFFPLVEGSIRDTLSNEALGPGKEGEICIRGYNVMQGYYKLPEATAKVIDQDGWLHTGDLGKIDENGYITYTGRLKELIIRGGENIAPSELENILAADPRVRQVKVIGVPDAHYTEEVCACVVKNDDSLSADDVRSLVAAQAACFKIPRYVLFLEELPLTAVGKVDLRMLRKLAVDKLAEGSDSSAE